jgi:hypothetical protein
VGNFDKQQWGISISLDRVLSETIITERFQLGIYFICTVIKR